jgi:hypothetical protein
MLGFIVHRTMSGGIGEGKLEKSKKKNYVSKKKSNIAAYKVYAHVRRPQIAHTAVRVCDTRQQDARRMDAARFHSTATIAKCKSSSLHHILVLRDLIYHPRQKLPKYRYF